MDFIGVGQGEAKKNGTPAPDRDTDRIAPGVRLPAQPVPPWNPLDHPICLSPPARLAPPLDWAIHIPLAMLLVDLLKPRTIVELAAETGNSYCAFCQAVKELALDTRCYGIDEGAAAPEALADLRAHHDPLYGGFSTLLRGTADELLRSFSDGTIDLLHLDGPPTYEAADRAFRGWLPKMSPRGVVLFHNVNDREPGRGAWRFWEEIKGAYPHFEVLHGKGLGILATGRVEGDDLRSLLQADSELAPRVRDFLFKAGFKLAVRGEWEASEAALRREVEAMKRELADLARASREDQEEREREHARLKAQFDEKEWAMGLHTANNVRALEAQHAEALERQRTSHAMACRQLEQIVHSLQGELVAISQSRAWRLMRAVRSAARPFMPQLRLCVRSARLAKKVLRTARREGLAAVARKSWRRLRRGGTHRVAPPDLLRPSGGAVEATGLPNCKASYAEYVRLEQEILSRSRGGYAEEVHRFESSPLISIVVPVYNTPKEVLEKTIASVERQIYPRWQLCLVDDCSTAPHIRPYLERLAKDNPKVRVRFRDENGNISESTNDGIRMATGDFVALLDHDDELAEDALFHVARLLDEKPETDIVYTDQDKIDEASRRQEPFFKPDWSPEYFRGVMYVGHLLVVRRALLEEVGGCDSRFDGVQDYELMLRLSEKTDRIEHIARILYHWRMVEGSIALAGDAKSDIDRLQERAVQEHLDRLGIEADAAMRGSGHRVRLAPRPRPDGPLVSILIPTKDKPELIGRCLESLYDKTGYRNFEVVVGDNETTSPKALRILERYPVKRVPLPGAFHFAAFNNRMAKTAKGEYLLLLNNDTEVLDADWLDHLLLHAERPDVGAAAPMLLYPDLTVQHAGVILGPRGTVDHVMRDFPSDADGYAGSLYCTREVTAVTAACLLVAREKFDRCGGLNERFRRHYEDVDFCLRLHSLGLRNIYVGTTRLIHHESKTRGRLYNYTDRVLLLDSWEKLIEHGDPYYNVNFDNGRCDYAFWTRALSA